MSPVNDVLGTVQVVDGADLKVIRSIVQLAQYDPLEDPDGFWYSAASAAAAVPDSMGCPPPSGLRLLRGLLANDELPETPRDSRRPAGRHVLLSEFWLSVFGLLLGTPVSYRGQQGSVLHQNVAPIPGSEQEESDVGSVQALPMHTENPFHVLPPDYVLFACLRSDPGGTAGTTVARVSDLAGQLDVDVVANLRRPIFAERGVAPPSQPIPVLRGLPDDPLARYDASWTSSNEFEGTLALDALARELPRCMGMMNLRAGDLLVLDNRRWLHGRTPFHASSEGLNRWLQRLYVCEESEHLKASVEQGDLVRAPIGPQPDGARAR